MMRPGGEGGSSLKDLLSVGIVTGIIQGGVGVKAVAAFLAAVLRSKPGTALNHALITT